MRRIYSVLLIIWLAGCSRGGEPHSPISATALQHHLTQFVESGPHRSGGPGDGATRDWFAGALRDFGYQVHIQALPIHRWVHERAYISAGNREIAGFPLWWPPAAPEARIHTGRLAKPGDIQPGDIALLPVAPQIKASITQTTRKALDSALSRGAGAAILVTHNLPGEPFAFNTSAEPEPMPIPVIIVGASQAHLLEQARVAGGAATLKLEGHYQDGATWNVVGRMARAGEHTVVISTPRTGWFSAGAERGPGVALFLELARWAADHGDADLVFVGTGGHELGHAGMEAFLADGGAPSPSDTALWIHLGASIAAWDWQSMAQKLNGGTAKENTRDRWLLYSTSMAWSVSRYFSGMDYRHAPSLVSTFGEARNIRAAGYKHFLAFAGAHPFFHLPGDDGANTSGTLLAPRARALQILLAEHL